LAELATRGSVGCLVDIALQRWWFDINHVRSNALVDAVTPSKFRCGAAAIDALFN
jgi:hypothetical protein